MMPPLDDQAQDVLRERDGRRLRAMGRVLLLAGLLVPAALGYVWLHVQRVRVAYQIEDLRGLRGELEERNRKLRLELLTLRAPGRVDREARQLGLREPAPDQVQLAREFAADEAAPALRTARARADDGAGAPRRR